MRTASILRAFLVSCFFFAAWSIAPVSDAWVCAEAPLRICSFNIRYGTANDGENHWEKRKDFLIETIESLRPDLIGTQETLGFQRDYLQQQLRQYTALGVGREDGRERGEMTALFYRSDRFDALAAGHFWLSESPLEAGSKSWDSSLPRMCSWVKLKDREAPGQMPIFFLNTHFDHRGQEARRQSALLVRKEAASLASNCSVVITGDFNDAVGSEPYRNLFQTGITPLNLIDTYAAATPANEPGEGTFSGFRAGAVQGERIDWIAVSSDWEILEAGIDRSEKEGQTPSDHFPIWTVLQR